MRRFVSALAITNFALACVFATSALAASTFSTTLAASPIIVAGPNSTPTPCPPGAVCKPVATPTPCRPNPAGPPCGPTPRPTTTPCHTATGARCKDLPDLAPLPPVRVGSLAHPPVPATTWGSGLSLTDADAFLKSNGRCAFNIWYEFKNIGTATAAPPFKNQIKVDGVTVVSINGPFAPLAAGASRAVQTQAYLPGGVHQLSLDLDSGNVVIESNKLNNHASIKYQLVGNCSDQR